MKKITLHIWPISSTRVRNGPSVSFGTNIPWKLENLLIVFSLFWFVNMAYVRFTTIFFQFSFSLLLSCSLFRKFILLRSQIKSINFKIGREGIHHFRPDKGLKGIVVNRTCHYIQEIITRNLCTYYLGEGDNLIIWIIWQNEVLTWTKSTCS